MAFKRADEVVSLELVVYLRGKFFSSLVDILLFGINVEIVDPLTFSNKQRVNGRLS